MTDRELTELAAKAAGYEFGYINDTPKIKEDRDFGSCGTWGCAKHQLYDWNPLDDDGDALRLAVKLKLDVMCHELGAHVDNELSYHAEISHDDPYTATRRAIVSAAAEIGKGMK